MSTFKIKHDKTKHAMQINTLDEKHKKFMNSFQSRRLTLPKKKKKLESLQSQLRKLENIDASKYTTIDIKKRSELRTEIKTLQDEIYDIENDISELDYYFKTEDIIMDYYQITEIDDHTLYMENPELGEEKQLDNGDNTKIQMDKLDMLNQLNKNKRKQKRITKRRKKRVTQIYQADIRDFFNGNIQQMGQANETFTEMTESECDNTETCSFTDVVNVDSIQTKNKAELLDQYMMIIDSEYICDKRKGANKIKKCDVCNIEKTLMHADGMYVCQQCAEAEFVIIDSEKPNYKEAVTDTKPGLKKHILRLCLLWPKKQIIFASL